MNVEVNFLAVVLAGVASMVVGFIWYGPFLFAKPWSALKGYTEKSLKAAQKDMGPLYGLSFVVSLVMAYVLSHVMTFSEVYYGYPRLTTGLMSAFWMWVGFVLPVQTTATIFGDKKWKLLAIDTGYQLVSLLAMGFVLGIME